MVFTRTSCAVRTGKSGILFSIPLFFLRRVCYNGASIMKKVHSVDFRPVTFVHFCHHTPQGDVGLNFSLIGTLLSHPARGRRILRCGLQNSADHHHDHTPQGDVGQDLTIISILALALSPESYTPARGRRTRYQNNPLSISAALITPRKGTQTTAPLYCTVLCGEAGRLLFCEILGYSRFFPQFFQLREFPQLLY